MIVIYHCSCTNILPWSSSSVTLSSVPWISGSSLKRLGLLNCSLGMFGANDCDLSPLDIDKSAAAAAVSTLSSHAFAWALSVLASCGTTWLFWAACFLGNSIGHGGGGLVEMLGNATGALFSSPRIFLLFRPPEWADAGCRFCAFLLLHMVVWCSYGFWCQVLARKNQPSECLFSAALNHWLRVCTDCTVCSLNVHTCIPTHKFIWGALCNYSQNLVSLATSVFDAPTSTYSACSVIFNTKMQTLIERSKFYSENGAP